MPDHYFLPITDIFFFQWEHGVRQGKVVLITAGQLPKARLSVIVNKAIHYIPTERIAFVRT